MSIFLSYIFFLGEQKQSQTIKPSEEDILAKIKEKKSLIINNKLEFNLTNSYPDKQLDVDLIETINRMQSHCFMFAQGCKHHHDLVKIFNLPYLYTPEFAQSKKKVHIYIMNLWLRQQ